MNFSKIERFFGKMLPAEYKNYVSSLHELFLEPRISFPLKEPTPFGDGVIEEFSSFDEIDDIEEMYFDDVEMLIVGGDSLGNCVCLSLQDQDFGSVYYWDHEQRALWDDNQFYEFFPNLAESIKEYLEKRRKGILPRKDEGMENFYFIAESFSHFLEICKPMDY